MGTIICTLIRGRNCFRRLTTARATEITLTIFLLVAPFFCHRQSFAFSRAVARISRRAKCSRNLIYCHGQEEREGSLWKWVFARGCLLYIERELNVAPARIISFLSNKLFLIPSETISFLNDTTLLSPVVIRCVIHNVSIRNNI